MKKLLKDFFDLKLDILLYLVLSVAMSVLSYYYQIYLGNKMDVIDYGFFNTVISFCSNIGIFFSPLTIHICRVVAEKKGSITGAKDDIKRVLIFAVGISSGITIFVCSLFVTGYGSHIGADNLFFACLIILVVVSAGIYSILSGCVQGASNLIFLGTIGFALNLLKYIFTRLMFSYSNNAYSPVYATLISNVLLIVLTSMGLMVLTKREAHRENVTCSHYGYFELIKLYGFTFLANSLFSPYVNGGEIVLLSSQYSAEKVGEYSLAIVIAKASIYIVSIFTTAMLPKFASAKENISRLKKLYMATLIVSLGFGVMWLIGLRTIGLLIIPKLFGEGYFQAIINTRYLTLWVVNIGGLLAINTFYMGIGELKKYTSVMLITTVFAILFVTMSSISLWEVPILLGVCTTVVIIWSVIDVVLRKSDI